MRVNIKSGFAAAAMLAAVTSSNATTWSVGTGGAAQGLVYTLDGTEFSSTQWNFTLSITGINTGNDIEGGRTSLRDLAFTQPEDFESALIPPSHYAQPGGLNSSGCNGKSADYFCFNDVNMAVTGPSMQMLFAISAPTASFASWVPHIKVDWAGTKKGNYDNVSLNMSVVPEAGTYQLALAATLAIGVMSLRRRSVAGGGAALGRQIAGSVVVKLQ